MLEELKGKKKLLNDLQPMTFRTDLMGLLYINTCIVSAIFKYLLSSRKRGEWV